MVFKILHGEEAGAVARPELPDFLHQQQIEEAEAEQEEAPCEPVIDEEELERIRQQAYEEGLALGKREGIEAARPLVERNLALLGRICHTLEAPLEQLDETVEEELLRFVVAIARQIVRRELKIDPGQIVALIREALALLPGDALHTTIHLHPDDAAFVRGALKLEGNRNIELREDPTLARGGCRVETESSQIDATLESRIAEIAARVLGGERGDDPPPEKGDE